MDVVLKFRFGGQPPRRTHQGGVQYCHDPRARGGIRVYIDEEHVAEAWQIRDAIRRQLPPEWTPSAEPVQVDVWLIYQQRKSDNLPDGVLIPHTERPDGDNLVKSIFDSAQLAGLIVDDAQIFDHRVRKFRGSVPRWGINSTFGGYGYLDGKKMPLDELKAAIRALRRKSRKQPPENDGQGVLGL